MIGLILTSFNDLPEIVAAYTSAQSHKKEQPFDLVIVDAGSTDGSIEYFESEGVPVLKDLKHLSESLNAGVDYFIEKDYDYISWIHPDMLFDIQPNWLKVLADELKANLEIGKLGPDNPGMPKDEEFRPGNTCPWLIPTEVFKAVHANDGYYFDEKYIYCGGYEDWDLNRRIIRDLKKKVLITINSLVTHEGMVSRKKPRAGIDKYHQAGSINAGYYRSKWGDSFPPC